MEILDAELLKRVDQGDEGAWTALYRRHSPYIYRFALRMSGLEAVAEEATQETFLALLNHRSRFDETRGSLRSWLLGVARNKTLGLLREERGFASIDDPAADDASSLVAWRTETADWVRAAVVALPVGHREVVVLCDLEELSYEEAARILDCPIGTVRSRLHRARRLLMDRLVPAEKRKGCLT